MAARVRKTDSLNVIQELWFFCIELLNLDLNGHDVYQA